MNDNSNQNFQFLKISTHPVTEAKTCDVWTTLNQLPKLWTSSVITETTGSRLSMVVTETLVMVINTLVLHIRLTGARILTGTDVILRISFYTKVNQWELSLFCTTFRIDVIVNGRAFSLELSVQGNLFPSKHCGSLKDWQCHISVELNFESNLQQMFYICGIWR